MVFFPNAKINIGLNISEKRSDNFHNIETVFYPIGLSDILEMVACNEVPNGLFQNSGIKIPGYSNKNLILKALELIKKDYRIPSVKIHLHKIIPIGAGLGGGSSDAAFFINLLNNFFSLNISEKKRMHYAQQLGSDCSFFIKNKPCFAYGRGEKLKEINLRLWGYRLILICPPIHVSTKDAYENVKPQKPEISLSKLIELPVREWRKNIFNQFEKTVFKKFPELKNIKTQLYDLGAVYSSLSGSGSSVYGLFEEIPKKIKFENYFIWQEHLR